MNLIHSKFVIFMIIWDNNCVFFWMILANKVMSCVLGFTLLCKLILSFKIYKLHLEDWRDYVKDCFEDF